MLGTLLGIFDSGQITSDQASKGILLGDSTICAIYTLNGVETYLLSAADILVGTTVNNQAVPANTILQQQTIWSADANKATYDWIVIAVGANDLAPAESAATALTRYQTLVNTINAGRKTSAVTITATMTSLRQRLIDVYGGTDGPIAYQKWLDMNTAIMGSGSNAITGVNYQTNVHTTALNDGNGNLASAYDYGDHVHSNNSGRSIIASAWESTLNAVGYLTA